MDKSGVDLSLLDELFMFNSILSEPSNITEGTEKRELIEKMVDKISMDHDGSNYLISVHFKYGIDMKKASLNFKLPELRTLLTINKTRKFSCLLLEVLLHWGLIAKYSS